MPRAKSAQRKRVNGTSAKQAEGEIVVEARSDTPTFYANHAELTNSPHDFAITFAQLPVKLTAEMAKTANERHKLFLEPTVTTIVPATLIPGLIRALTVRKEMYEKMFGPIRDDANKGEGQ